MWWACDPYPASLRVPFPMAAVSVLFGAGPASSRAAAAPAPGPAATQSKLLAQANALLADTFGCRHDGILAGHTAAVAAAVPFAISASLATGAPLDEPLQALAKCLVVLALRTGGFPAYASPAAPPAPATPGASPQDDITSAFLSCKVIAGVLKPAVSVAAVGGEVSRAASDILARATDPSPFSLAASAVNCGLGLDAVLVAGGAFGKSVAAGVRARAHGIAARVYLSLLHAAAGDIKAHTALGGPEITSALFLRCALLSCPCDTAVLVDVCVALSSLVAACCGCTC